MKRNILFLFIFTCLLSGIQGQSAWLDSSFHQQGYLTTHLTGANDEPAISLAYPDGKSIIVGYSYFDHGTVASAYTAPVIMRFDQWGNPDPAFGASGTVVLNQLKNDANATDAVLQPDGKLLITGQYLNSTIGPHHFIARLLENGDPDPTFGENGVTGYPDPDLVAWGNVLTLQPDGKILMGGSRFTYVPPGSGYLEFILFRFNADGSVDASFGNNGQIVEAYQGYNSAVTAIQVAPDHSIFVGCQIFSVSILFKYTQDGKIDTSFAISGLAGVEHPGGISNILLQDDGRIVVAGSTKSSSATGFIWRFNADGSDDLTFDSSPIEEYQNLVGLIQDTSDVITMATNESGQFKLIRWTADGQVDWNQYASVDISGSGYYFANGLSALPDGFLLAGGSFENSFGVKQYALLRMWNFGAPDADFGDHGFVTKNAGSGHSRAASVLVDSTQNILVGGEAGFIDATTIINIPTYNIVGFVSKYTLKGELDTSFNHSGFRAMPHTGASLNLLARQNDGKVLVAGSSDVMFGSNFNTFRMLPDGAPDEDYGQGGAASIDLSFAYEAHARAVAVAADHSSYVMGHILNTSNKRVVTVVRIDSSGFPYYTFGADGVALYESVTGNPELHAGIMQPDGKLLLAGTTTSPTPNIFLLRLLPDGTPDPDFGVNGIIAKPFGGIGFYLEGLDLQPDGRILLCGRQNNNVLIGRLLANGTRDNSFSDDGMLVLNTGSAESGNAIKITLEGKILIAGYSTDNTSSNPLLIRLLADGTPDPDFGTNGVLITDIPGENQLTALALSPDSSAYLSVGISDDEYLLVRYLSKFNVGTIDLPDLIHEITVYPNPLHESAILEYSLNAAERITIDLIDMSGKTNVRLLENTARSSGTHTETLHLPATLNPGCYTLRIMSAKEVRVVKVIL